jgi:hypothetical protein
MNHGTSTAVKLENFISARDLNYKQFLSMLQDLDAEHTDVPYTSAFDG